LSNGFKLRQNGQQINRSGASYIFMALAEHPTGGAPVFRPLPHDNNNEQLCLLN
jgi:hypothetical protein